MTIAITYRTPKRKVAIHATDGTKNYNDFSSFEFARNGKAQLLKKYRLTNVVAGGRVEIYRKKEQG